MEALLQAIRACTVCEPQLPLGPRPVVALHRQSKILVIGQAPGSRVHQSGVPWQDASGNTLRQWLGVNNETFYDPQQLGLLPMGFCYPGKGKSGDLPPRPECAPLWHPKVFEQLEDVRLTLLIGTYAQACYLKARKQRTLTETVEAFASYLPTFFPLPHPSPRNRIWLRKNPWFEAEVLPVLKKRVSKALSCN